LPPSVLLKRHQVRVGFPVEMDLQAALVVPASTATTAKTEGLAPSAFPERTEHVVLQGNLDRGAIWAHRAFVVGAAPLVPRASPVLVVSLVPKEVLATTAFKAPPALGASPAKMDAMASPPSCLGNQVHPALLEGMAVPASTVALVSPAKTAETARTAFEGVVGPSALLAHPAIPVKTAKTADLVKRDPLERMVSTVKMAGMAATV